MIGMAARAVECPPAPTPEQRKALQDYVEKKYKLPQTITLTLKTDSLVGDTCYRELTFQGASPVRTWDLTLYASPDLRFLTSDLFDRTVDPVAEQRVKDDLVMKGLVHGAKALRGPDRAAVTIAEFSDFQCPYCKKFAKILNDVLTDGAGDVRVVFHHLPLSMHPWARLAAETTACAQLQSGTAFWSLHDRIFDNQGSITAENAKATFSELGNGVAGLDHAAFQQCLDNGLSVGLVLRDLNLAESNQVIGTPTLFINGHRIAGVENADRLRELIAEARKEGALPASASEPNSVHVVGQAQGDLERPEHRNNN